MNSDQQKLLSTRSHIIPSSQSVSIIFHNVKFLQLQGVLLTHPPKVDKKRELTQLNWVNALIAVPQACKYEFTLIKTEKREQLPTTKEREIVRIVEFCKEK